MHELMSDTTKRQTGVHFAEEQWSFQDLVAEHQRQLDAACQMILGALAERRDSTEATTNRGSDGKYFSAIDSLMPENCMAALNHQHPRIPKESCPSSIPSRLSLASWKSDASRFPSRMSKASRQSVASRASQFPSTPGTFAVKPRAHHASMVSFDASDSIINPTNSLDSLSSMGSRRSFRPISQLSPSNVGKRATQLKTHVKATFANANSLEQSPDFKCVDFQETQSFSEVESVATVITSQHATISQGSSFSMKANQQSGGGLLEDVKRISAHPNHFKSRAVSVIPALPEQFVAQAAYAQNVFEKIVSSPLFDTFCAFVIVSFMIMLGYETHMSSQRPGEKYYHFFVATLAFNSWFAFELLLRIAAERQDFLWKSTDWAFNILDTLLVLTSVMELVFEIIIGGEESMDDSLGVTRAARVVRILRALRAVRLARVMQHVMEFRKMVCLIQGSITTLFWCLLLVFLLIYTFAVLFTQGVTDHLSDNAAEKGEMSFSNQQLKVHYGSIPRSINSLFQSMATGVNWGVVFEPMLNMGWPYSVAFIVFISFSMFGVLNVLTSCFVESTVQIALTHRDLIQHEHEKQMGIAVKHLREVFLSIDYRGEGRMKKSEMTFFLQDPFVHSYLEALDINLHDSETLFKLLDADGSGEIDVDEFCRGCLKLKGHAKSFDLHCLISEVARFLDKWSSFTEFAVAKFQDLEACQQKGPELIKMHVEQHDEVLRCSRKQVDSISKKFLQQDEVVRCGRKPVVHFQEVNQPPQFLTTKLQL